ncbi:MAG: phosphocholine cytidylyltransferase family protein [Magnetococcales bacterium]|nr:phosphocholine cytidylyltransferase family protein [Magnetococcales bacterium]
MVQMVEQAIILAAGMGTRLKAFGKHTPKGFLRLGERPIIEESLEKLWRVGIERVVVVTGHLNEFYDNLAAESGGRVETVFNPLYAESGSMYSLFLAREKISQDFLLLESDLIYEQRALEEAIHFSQDHCILLSGPTNAGDEVYVTGHNGGITGMSKEPVNLQGVVGELVGISKISNMLFKSMLTSAQKRFENTLQVAYETDCLVDVAAKKTVHYHMISDLLWTEIDDESHLQRASSQIYPAILGLETIEDSGR